MLLVFVQARDLLYSGEKGQVGCIRVNRLKHLCRGDETAREAHLAGKLGEGVGRVWGEVD